MKTRWNSTPQAPEFPEPVQLAKRIPGLLRAAVLNPIDSGCAGSSGATLSPGMGGQAIEKSGFSMGAAAAEFSMQRQPRTAVPFVGLSA